MNKEKLKKAIFETIEMRCKTEDEIRIAVYSMFDILYEVMNFNEYQELFDEVQEAVDKEYDVFII